jgi:hypothetical protein
VLSALGLLTWVKAGGQFLPDQAMRAQFAAQAIGVRMAKASPVIIPRDVRLDLYRGGALWLIFLGHVPGTVFNQITPWNYGFSDPAEIFIFVSGYANAYVYGRVMEQRGFLVAGAQIGRHAFETYVAQMFLFVIFIGEVAWLSHGSHTFDDAMNIRILYGRPDESILAVMQLKFMPVNMDVLPLYIVVLAASPAIIWLLREAPALVLAVAVALYAAANLMGLNFRSFPQGHWYFNPLAWQLLFVLGAWCGLGAAGWVWVLIRSRLVLILAAIYALAVFAAFIALKRLNLEAFVPEWIAHAFGKTNLGVLRMVHFLALAIVVDRLIPREWPPLTWRVLRPLTLCGQHSLEVFCLGVTLAFAGQVAVVGAPGSVTIRLLVDAAGIGVMVAAGALISWYNSTRVAIQIVAQTADEQANFSGPAAERPAMRHVGPGPF